MPARRALRVATRGVGSVVAVFVGAGYFWRGLGRFLRSPRMWPFAVVPAILVYAALTAIATALGRLAGAFADWATGFAGDWPGWLRGVVRGAVELGVDLAAHAALGFLALPLALLAGAGFYVSMARGLERRLGEDPALRRPPWYRAAAFATWQTVLVTLVATLGWALLVPLLLIPGVNVAAAVAAVIFGNGFLAGLLALGLPLHHRGVLGWRAHLRYAWSRRAHAIGFGSMSMLVLSLPLAPLRWVTVPAVFVGAVLLYRRVEGPAPPAPPPSGMLSEC